MTSRAVGTEVEFGILPLEEGKSYKEVMSGIDNKILPKRDSVRSYLENGGRIYEDIGLHPEIATPECRTVKEVLIYERALEDILSDRLKCIPVKVVKDCEAFSTSDEDYETFGYHENYGVPLNYGRMKDLLRNLQAHLITRVIYTGAGSTIRGKYLLSQRLPFIKIDLFNGTSGNRGLASDRPREGKSDVPLINRRLHLTCADSNMSEYATFLKLGTTLSLINMYENGWRSSLELKNPQYAAKTINEDISLRSVVELKDGRKMNAINIQEKLLEEAMEFYEKMINGDENQEIYVLLKCWEEILEDLRKDIFSARDRVDWIMKLKLINDLYGSYDLKPELNHKMEIDSISIEYHSLGEDNLREFLEENGFMRRITNSDEVEYARKNPVKGARSEVRSRIIRIFHPDIEELRWHCAFLNYDGVDLKVEMPEPLNNSFEVYCISENHSESSEICKSVSKILKD